MRLFCIFISVLSLFGSAQAHEYWVEPKAYAVTLNGNVSASLYNGENFKGMEFPYYANHFSRFQLALGDRVEPVEGRIGDYPALNMPALGDGLHTVVFVSRGDLVNHAELAKFISFATMKGFDDVEALHVARGLPLINTREYYTRYSKALVAVDSGEGQDRTHGLETEIIALKNPYTDDLGESEVLLLPVRVIYRGAVRADVQVDLFDKDVMGQVTTSKHRTNSEGVAQLPVVKGHSYLVNSVVLREPETGSPAVAKGAVWETLWAALTFAVPE